MGAKDREASRIFETGRHSIRRSATPDDWANAAQQIMQASNRMTLMNNQLALDLISALLYWYQMKPVILRQVLCQSGGSRRSGFGPKRQIGVNRETLGKPEEDAMLVRHTVRRWLVRMKGSLPDEREVPLPEKSG
jgi:hypothetical protein